MAVRRPDSPGVVVAYLPDLDAAHRPAVDLPVVVVAVHLRAVEARTPGAHLLALLGRRLGHVALARKAANATVVVVLSVSRLVSFSKQDSSSSRREVRHGRTKQWM